MSRLDNSSIKDEQDKTFRMNENLTKDKTTRKTGEANAPKNIVLNTSDIIGRTFLMPPQEYGQTYRVCIVKIINDQKNNYHKTQVKTSSYVHLILINTNILCHTMTLSISLQTIRMRILCVN